MTSRAVLLYIPHMGTIDLRTLLDYQLAQLLRQQEGLRSPDADQAVATIAQEIEHRAIRKRWREEGSLWRNRGKR